MKKRIILLALFASSYCNLQAQETQTTTGVGAASASSVAQANNWENWVFAGSAMITAAAGIFVITMGNGKSSSAH